jgi:hypothetical protein
METADTLPPTENKYDQFDMKKNIDLTKKYKPSGKCSLLALFLYTLASVFSAVLAQVPIAVGSALGALFISGVDFSNFNAVSDIYRIVGALSVVFLGYFCAGGLVAFLINKSSRIGSGRSPILVKIFILLTFIFSLSGRLFVYIFATKYAELADISTDAFSVNGAFTLNNFQEIVLHAFSQVIQLGLHFLDLFAVEYLVETGIGFLVFLIVSLNFSGKFKPYCEKCKKYRMSESYFFQDLKKVLFDLSQFKESNYIHFTTSLWEKKKDKADEYAELLLEKCPVCEDAYITLKLHYQEKNEKGELVARIQDIYIDFYSENEYEKIKFQLI